MNKKILLLSIILVITSFVFVAFLFSKQIKTVFSFSQPSGTFSIIDNDNSYISQTPVTLTMDIKNAKEMRFGNTVMERSLSRWEAYAPTKEWLLKTGPGFKTVYAEFRNSNKITYQTTADHSVGLVMNNFDKSQENWWSYNYDNNIAYNIFYPTTWESKGGINNSGYIWVGDSRWSIDTPEEPDSILSLLTYPSWSGKKSMDLRGAEVSVYLRGDDLDLKGAQIYFWVLSRARWHFIGHPLTVSQGEWGEKLTFKLISDESLWHRSYTANPSLASLDYTLGVTDSYGFSFVGFPEGQKVTGRLFMDEFEIKPKK